MDIIKIGQFIATKRQAVGLTQAQLAAIIDLTPQAVSMWETGKRFPDPQYILPLCKALTINPIELLEGREMEDRSLRGRINNYLSTTETDPILRYLGDDGQIITLYARVDRMPDGGAEIREFFRTANMLGSEGGK